MEEVKVLVSGKDGKIYRIVPTDSASCKLCCFDSDSCIKELRKALGKRVNCIGSEHITGQLLGTASNCCHYEEIGCVSGDIPFDYSKLRVDDRVLIKKPSDEEVSRWGDVWVDKMDKMVGTVVTIKCIREDAFTIKWDGVDFIWPPCCIVRYA